MKCLVTGGGGFLGRHIVDKLLARGDHVRVLGRRAYPDLAGRGVECVLGDIADAESVAAACADVDAVFHVAALAGIWGERDQYVRANVTGTINVLAGCQRHGVHRLVYTSTPSVVYGRDPIDGGDESLPYPSDYLTAYAETKAEAERAVLVANGRDLHTCALRPHLIFGPGDNHLIPRVIARAKAGKLKQVGDGSNLVSVSYVENVADAHLAACDRLTEGSAVCGQAYFINQEEPVRLWDFIRQILAGVGAPPVKRSVPTGVAYTAGAALEAAWKLFGRQDEPPMTRFVALQLATSHWFRIDKARRDLDWTPAVPTDEGLQRLVRSMQQAADRSRAT